MVLDIQAKKSIIDQLNKFYLTQEAKVRSLFIDFEFSIGEIKKMLEDLQINRDLIKLNEELLEKYLLNLSPSISRFYYETKDKNKIRELDFKFVCIGIIKDDKSSKGKSTPLDKKYCLFRLNFIGDIKNTNDYRWVFSERIRSFDFPFPFFQEISTDNTYTKNPFMWNDKFLFPMSIVNNMTPFDSKEFEIAENKKNKKEKKTGKELVREFFDQVVSGTQASIERTISLLKPPSSIRVLSITVPVLIISNPPILVPNLPASSPDEITEEKAVLYLYNPTYTPTLNVWRVPILVIDQTHAVEVIKKMTVAIFAQLASRPNFEVYTVKT